MSASDSEAGTICFLVADIDIEAPVQSGAIKLLELREGKQRNVYRAEHHALHTVD